MNSIRFILLGIAAILIGVIGSNLAVGGEPFFVFITIVMAIVGAVLCLIGVAVASREGLREDEKGDKNKSEKNDDEEK